MKPAMPQPTPPAKHLDTTDIAKIKKLFYRSGGGGADCSRLCQAIAVDYQCCSSATIQCP